MSEILFVSKPMAPPWNDGSKTLVRDIGGALTRHQAVLLGVRGVPLVLGSARVEPLFYQPNEGFGLSGTPAMRLAARLASGRRGDLWHFVFAPNVRTSRTARALSRLRRVRTVQTVASVPRDDEDLGASLFGDRVVVLSRRTERRFLEHGFPASRLRLIPPCVAPIARDVALPGVARRALGLPADAPLVVFPGDLERDRGGALTMEAFAKLPSSLGALLVMATRRKTVKSAEAERALRQRAGQLGIDGRVRWAGETLHLHGLLAAASVVALPATDLVAKVDIPIVLLESVSLGTPVVLARGSSAEDLVDAQGVIAVDAEVEALAAALEQIVRDTNRRASLPARYRPSEVAAAYEAVYDELLR